MLLYSSRRFASIENLDLDTVAHVLRVLANTVPVPFVDIEDETRQVVAVAAARASEAVRDQIAEGRPLGSAVTGRCTRHSSTFPGAPH